MKTAFGLLLAVCLGTLGCKDDPARSVKVIERPVAPAAPAPRPVRNPAKTTLPVPAPTRVYTKQTPVQDLNWQAEFCPPPAETAGGPSDLTVSGPCQYKQKAQASCEGSKDDFYVAFTRQAKHGATLVTYLNVEAYHGPGTYEQAQMFIAVQSGTKILRWSSDNVNATVGPGEAFVTIPGTQLEAEPMLVDCTRLIGPSSNYQYQCALKADGASAREVAPEVVSGKIQCGESKK